MKFFNNFAALSLSLGTAGAALSMAPAGADPLPINVDPACSAGLDAARAAMEQIDPPMEGARWVIDRDFNYNPCRDLSFVTITTEGGTGSSPDQLLLFHKDQFLGTGTIVNVPFQKIVDSGDDFVTVSYGLPGSSNAEVQWQEPVTYRWVNDHVEMEGELPPELAPA